MTAFPPEYWLVFRDMTGEQFAELLLRVARQIKLSKYKQRPDKSLDGTCVPLL